jgi:archaellum component FlaC
MDLYEAMNGLTDRVNTCIATYNDVMANSYQALRNLEHAAEANGAYYGDCEVSTEQGYYADEGNTYCVTRKKVVDRFGEPIRMQLKLAYDNTTNSKLEQPIDDASMIECAQVIASCEVGEDGWVGNCFYKGAPLPSIESGDGYCVAFTRNGTMRVYANAINQSQLLNDGVENSMSCVGRIIVDGEVKDEVAAAVAPIVAMGQNTVTKEVFFVSAGSDANQVKQGLTNRGLSSKACADILKGYGCDIAVVLSTDDNAMLLDKGENAFVPSTLPNQVKAKAFWYITRKAHYKNDYDRQLAELIQNYGQLRYTALLNQLSILNLKNYTEAEISRIDAQLHNFENQLEAFNVRLTEVESKYNALVERVDTVEADLAQVKQTINTLQQTVQNLIDIVNGMQNTIAKIQQTLTQMENGTVKLPYIEKVDGVGTGTTKLENITVSGDATISDLDVKTECWLPTPTQPLQGANKKYVDEAITASLGSGEYLPLRGGTMSGDIIMGNNALSGVNKMLFNNGSGFVNSSAGVIVATMQTLRGQSYTAPTNNNDYTQKKYVDDKIAAAVIEATQGGLTETVADTKYLKLDGTNEPTAPYVWNTSLTLNSVPVFFDTAEETSINSKAYQFAYDSDNIAVLTMDTFEAGGIPYITIVFQDPDGIDMPVYGAYKNKGENGGFFVTDTYLDSSEYKKAAGFVKKTGDTMSGRLIMGGNELHSVGGVRFNNGTGIVPVPNEQVIRLSGGIQSTAIKAKLRNVDDPTDESDAVPLSYLKEYCEGKTQDVTLTGVVDTILAHNTEYTIKDFTALTLVCDNAKTAENHGYIKFPNVPIVPTLTGFSGIDGDDIAQAAANEVWEFSCFKGYMLFKNWGVAA